jgi:hypothetical protein
MAKYLEVEGAGQGGKRIEARSPDALGDACNYISKLLLCNTLQLFSRELVIIVEQTPFRAFSAVLLPGLRNHDKNSDDATDFPFTNRLQFLQPCG